MHINYITLFSVFVKNLLYYYIFNINMCFQLYRKSLLGFITSLFGTYIVFCSLLLLINSRKLSGFNIVSVCDKKQPNKNRIPKTLRKLVSLVSIRTVVQRKLRNFHLHSLYKAKPHYERQRVNWTSRDEIYYQPIFLRWARPQMLSRSRSKRDVKRRDTYHFFFMKRTYPDNKHVLYGIIMALQQPTRDSIYL